MQEIRVLDPHVIDHIAAGEVVERPASVVKELLENALDAGANTVEIQVEDGGLGRLIITDDGYGMTPENARRCVLRHATSKLRCADDLFRIGTLGFRGEALSSIAAVSEFGLTTRPLDALEGLCLRLRAGQVELDEPVGCPPGTTITVDNLFFNTPARRKFMRAPATEQAHVVEAVTRVMLAHRRGGVLLRSGTRRLLDIHPEAQGAQRVLAALGVRVGTLYPLAAEVDGVQVEGVMSAPEICRSDAKGLWLFVNGRFVRDRVLQRAVVESCREVLPPGRYPTVVLHVDLPADQVDVNVHPQKLEVRFANGAAVYRAVVCALAQVVAMRPWDAGVQVRRAPGGERPHSDAVSQIEMTAAPLGGGAAAMRPGGASAASGGVVSRGDGLFVAGAGIGARDASGLERSTHLQDAARSIAGSVAGQAAGSSIAGSVAGQGAGSRIAGFVAGQAAGSRIAGSGDGQAAGSSIVGSVAGQAAGSRIAGSGDGQAAFSSIELLASLLGRYWIGRTAQTLVLVDWHRLAAQQAMAQLRAEADAGDVRRTALLLPEALDAQAPWASWLETAWESLTDFGFELEPVAPGRYAVRAVPEALAAAPCQDTALSCVQTAFAGRAETDRGALRRAVFAACVQHLRGLPAQDVAQAMLNDLDAGAAILHLGAEDLARLLK